MLGDDNFTTLQEHTTVTASQKGHLCVFYHFCATVVTLSSVDVTQLKWTHLHLQKWSIS